MIIKDLPGQTTPAVRWEYRVSQRGTDRAVITFTVFLKKGWHLYTQQGDTRRVLPPTFYFESSVGYELTGKMQEQSSPVSRYDVIFGRRIFWLEYTAVFTQPVRLSGRSVRIKGKVAYTLATDDGYLTLEEEPFLLGIQLDRLEAGIQDKGSRRP
jgi:hypothetical protein